ARRARSAHRDPAGGGAGGTGGSRRAARRCGSTRTRRHPPESTGRSASRGRLSRSLRFPLPRRPANPPLGTSEVARPGIEKTLFSRGEPTICALRCKEASAVTRCVSSRATRPQGASSREVGQDGQAHLLGLPPEESREEEAERVG